LILLRKAPVNPAFQKLQSSREAQLRGIGYSFQLAIISPPFTRHWWRLPVRKDEITWVLRQPINGQELSIPVLVG
jgi:hypothetical protein